MTSRDFAYWLQGFFEVSDAKTITEDQVKVIKNHLNLVFHHEIDKQYKPGDGSQEVHDGLIKPPVIAWKPQGDSPLIRC